MAEVKYSNFEIVANESQYLTLYTSFIELLFSEIFKDYHSKWNSDGFSLKAYCRL